MLKLTVHLLVAVTVLLAGGLWAVISNDRWPLDDRRQPARAVWELNRKVGRWLTDHAEPPRTDCFVPTPGPEPLTAEEQARVDKALKAMPTHQTLVLNQVKHVKPGALAPSLNLSTTGGGGGGGCGTARRG